MGDLREACRVVEARKTAMIEGAGGRHTGNPGLLLAGYDVDMAEVFEHAHGSASGYCAGIRGPFDLPPAFISCWIDGLAHGLQIAADRARAAAEAAASEEGG